MMTSLRWRSLGSRAACWALLAAGAAALGCSDGVAKPPEPEPTVYEVKAATAIRDITPAFEGYTDIDGNGLRDAGEPFDDLDGDGEHDSLWMGGFGPRQPTGVHDPLEARTVAVSVDGRVFTITALDAFGVSRARIAAIQQAAFAQLGESVDLPPARMIIASTHTHAAPDTVGVYGADSLLPAWDDAYLDELVSAAAASIVEATSALEPAEVVATHAEAGAGFVQDEVAPSIIEPQVGIVQLRRTDDGSAIATLTSTANHPRAAGPHNSEISADYVGVLRASLEQELGGTAVAVVGALGLVQAPAEVGEPGFARVSAIGVAYAGVVSAALADRSPIAAEEAFLLHVYDEVRVPFQNSELFLAFDTGVVEGYDEYLYDDGTGTCALACFDMPVAVLRIGHGVTFVTVAGELSPELVLGGIVSPPNYEGEYADADAEEHLTSCVETPERFVVGLAQADVGYVYPKMTFDPDAYPDQRQGFGPDVAAPLMGGTCNLVREVNANSARY